MNPKSILFFCILIGLLSASARGAIAFDAKSSESTNSIASTTLTWSHTVSAGSDRILVVGVVISNSATTVTSITFNGTNLTSISSTTNTGLRVELWRLLAPTSGTYDIVVTISASQQIIGEAHSFTGVDQTTPITGGHTATGSGTYSSACCANNTITNSITSANLEFGVDVLGIDNINSTPTASQNAGNSNVLHNGTNRLGGGSYKASTGASVSLSWTTTWVFSYKWAWVGVSLNPVSLPIELYSFAGECKDQKTVLSWTTASELNNDYFTIEKSNDGKKFQTVATVNGAGNSSTFKNYSITDEAAAHTIIYYRLTQTDYDGRSEIFPIIAVNDCAGENNPCVDIFPNPAPADAINIYVSGMEKRELMIEVHSIAGELLFSQNIFPDSNDFNSSVNIPFRPGAGVYIITGRSEKGSCRTKLVLK